MADMATITSVARQVRVEQVMGTAIGLDIREPFVPPSVVEQFFNWLRSVDLRFSTYREDSLVSRMRRGDEPRDPDLAEVLATCERVRMLSDGAFDIWTHNPEGVDPSALVKGWSVDRGAQLLAGAGARNFCVNAGGDVLAIGERAPGEAWRIGIRHPVESGKVAAVIAARDMAVATSGTYERGEHIRQPGTFKAPVGLLSATVAGPQLALADAYSTAAFAMGASAGDWLARLPGYAGMVVGTDLRTRSTRGLETIRVS
jgi:thiamine biosynthesis lipoprotein